jgi:hypothetical protein
MAAGAALALLALGLVAVARRPRARPRTVGHPGLPTEPPPAWRAALAQLEDALARAEASPEGAADAASLALRRFLAQRFSVAGSLTAPELRELPTPLGLERDWSALLGVLGRLDDLRFRPRGESGASLASEARDAIERARAWVGEAVPEARVR